MSTPEAAPRVLPEISVVVPAYNEEARIAFTLPQLWQALRKRFAAFEVIVVDDGSSDATARIVSEFAGQHQNVRLIRHQENHGKGHAVRAGVLAARGDIILFSDTDLSTPIREVRKLLGALEEGHDIAIGSRALGTTRILQRQPFYRIGMGKIFNRLVRLLTVRGISDTQCGFKCFRRSAALEIFPCCRIDGFSFDVEVLFIARKKGLRVKEVGVIWRNSPQSKVNPVFHSLQMLRDLFVIRLHALAGSYGRRHSAPE